MTGLLHRLLDLPPVWVLVVTFTLVFLEDAVFVGFVLPAEAATVLAGVTTAVGTTNYPLTMLVVVVAAIAGDSVGYEVGHRFFGPRAIDSRFLRRHRDRIDAAQDLIRRRGGIAVFLGRFQFFLRAMVPALAGAARLRYRTFLVWNAIGGVVWGVLWVSVGHLAGASYEGVEQRIGRGIAVALVVIVVVGLVVWHFRRERPADSGDAGAG